MASNREKGSKRKIGDASRSRSRMTWDQLVIGSIEARKKAEEKIALTCTYDRIDPKEQNHESIKCLVKFPFPTSVDHSIRSPFHRTNGWCYGDYREQSKVPQDRRNNYRILPTYTGSSMIGEGKCIHFAAVYAIEARLRILSAKRGGPRIPKLSVQEVINAVRSNYCEEIFNWILENGLVAERKCPFIEGLNDFRGPCEGKRYYIDTFNFINPRHSKMGFFIGCLELKNEGPFVISYKVRSNKVYLSSDLKKYIIYVKEGPTIPKAILDKEGRKCTVELQHSVVAIGHVNYDGKNCYLFMDPEEMIMGIIHSDLVELMILPRLG